MAVDEQDGLNELDLDNQNDNDNYEDDEPNDYVDQDTNADDDANVDTDTPVYKPAVFNPSGNPYMEALTEQLGPEIAATLVQAQRWEHQQSSAATAAAGAHFNRAREAMPEYFRENEAKISEVERFLPNEVRGTAKGALFAMMAPAIDEAEKTGDVAGALLKMAAQIKDSKSSTQRRAEPLHPSERVPSPTGGGGVSRAPAQASSKGPVGTMARIFGFPEDEMATMIKKSKRVNR